MKYGYETYEAIKAALEEDGVVFTGPRSYEKFIAKLVEILKL